MSCEETCLNKHMPSLLLNKCVWPIIDLTGRCRMKEKQASLCLITGKEKGKGRKTWWVKIQQWPLALRVSVFCVSNLHWGWAHEAGASSSNPDDIGGSSSPQASKVISLSSRILQEALRQLSQMCVCLCVWLCKCMFFFFNNLVLKEKLYMCTSDGLQCEYIKLTGGPLFSQNKSGSR